ncbi:TetR/AcrR family transcriptional regulator [Wenjunlia tyrosinilytica]|uniref:TetR family transcriptional regulator n=1 Tax=Wenjunlia tyrosinilytica TaxID=1544741 RepID=A0A917ZWD8_9ACTN|nr:TetR family transcriptional regulator [Wenjunlia tyrosinilytica]GGO98949.1 TetR family transcriptional regulator [Wenjunlia tyrosinilytica]
MTAEAVDGRRAKGERRRALLLEAALRVVERDGVAGVTHRAVAKEAGQPPSSATYYFESIDDLLVAALVRSVDAYAARLREATESPDPVAALAETLAAELARGRAPVIAEYELYLLAARRPALRATAQRCVDDLAALARRCTGDPVAVKAFCACVDGLLLQALVTGASPDASGIEAVLRLAMAGSEPAGGVP